MTRLFATSFPVKNTATLDELAEIVNTWLAGSPHCELNYHDISSLKEHGSNVMKNGHSLTLANHLSDSMELRGFRYSSPGYRDSTWISEIVGLKSKDSTKVSIVVDFESPIMLQNVPAANKPYIVKQVISRLGGGIDSCLPVSNAPVYLKDEDTHANILFISSFMKSEGGNSLPVVYVSSINDSTEFGDRYYIDPASLAKELQGMAHVVVEPSRSFSKVIMKEAARRNAFGGAIGLYWPKSYTTQIIKPDAAEFDGISSDKLSKAMHESIYRSISSRLNHMRLPIELQYGNINTLHTQAMIDRIRKTASTETADLKELAELYVQSNSQLASSLQEERDRVFQLENDLAIARASIPVQGTGELLNTPQIVEIYPGEISDVISNHALGPYLKQKPQNRAVYLLQKVAESNPARGSKQAILDELHPLFRSYKEMTPNFRKALLKHGFLIEEQGKHYQIYHSSDSSRKLTLSKTGSDWRGGENHFSDFKEKFF